VIGGFETLAKMEKAPTAERDRPVTAIKIERITVHANPLADS
jgi:peptidyl-prolyl cis-trans isomerase-like 3